MGSDSDEDRKQRDEFAERLKKRDESQKRKVVPRSGRQDVTASFPHPTRPLSHSTFFAEKHAFEEAAKRLKLENERDRASLIPRLRVESRRQYLKKRTVDKVTELEQDLADDEYLFNEEEYAALRNFCKMMLIPMCS